MMSCLANDKTNQKRKNFLFGVYFGLASIALSLLLSFSFSNTILVQRESLGTNLQVSCDASNSEYVYSLSENVAEEDPLKRTTVGFQKQYELFSADKYTSWPMLLSLDTSGKPLEISLNYTAGDLQYSHAVSMGGISFDHNGDTFQTLRIELAQKTSSNKTYSSDETFLYLPDYIADEIIDANTEDNYSDYDDLINSGFTLDYALSGKQFHSHVKNVFHVKGFHHLSANESFLGIDGDHGEKIRSFLGDFVISTQREYFIQGNVKLFCMTPGKKGTVNFLGDNILSSANKGSWSIAIYYKNGQGYVPLPDSGKINNLYFLNCKWYWGINGPALVSFLILFSGYFILLFRFLRFYNVSANYLVGGMVIFILYSSLFETLISATLIRDFAIFSFYNAIGNVFLLCSWLFIFVFSLKRLLLKTRRQ